MKKVCILGDSISKGIVLDNHSKYHSTTNSFVNLFADSKQFLINNFSIFGCTVTKGLQIFLRQHEKIHTSDIILTEFGGNDCDFDWAAIANDPTAHYTPKTPLESFCEQYKKMIELIIKAGKNTVILNLPPLDDEKYFKWVSRDRNADNILKWLGGNSKYIYRWHEMYNDAVCNVAKNMNVLLIDIRTEFLKLRDYSDYLCDDGIHPNERGHKLIYNKIFSFSENYMIT